MALGIAIAAMIWKTDDYENLCEAWEQYQPIINGYWHKEWAFTLDDWSNSKISRNLRG